jgi:hypothetical protein
MEEGMKTQRRIGLLMLVVLLLTGVSQAQEGGAPQTGTDPRDFANKFMPYFRYTELENGLVQKETVLFGLYALSPKMALTYEVPLGYERDVKDTALFVPGTGCVPGGGSGLPGGGFPLPNGLPAGVIDGLEGDCKETGIGDMNMRLIARAGKWLGADWLVGTQVNFPTASEDVLGSETFSVAPMVAQVADLKFWPGPGAFAAFMHFYQFDITKDAARDDQSMYIGRYFFMLPLSKKFKLYALPEFQPIYDFVNDEFSFWAAPEFGKMLGGGNVLYAKPGWGIDSEDLSGERKVSFEIGWRKFM